MTVQNLTEAPNAGQKAVLLFWAPWHEGSVGPMSQILEALDATNNNTMLFARVEAEQAPAISKKYQVTMVPTFVLIDESGSVVERMEGVEDVAQVTQAVARLQARAPAAASSADTALPTKTMNEKDLSAEERLTKRLNSLIRSSEVMLFIKGTPTNPRCGFSRQAVDMLEEEKISFSSFDILSDEIVRQGLKKHSNWPTYPQLYVNGELIGGLDIMKEMKEQGLLREQLGIVAASKPVSSLDERLKQLINRSKIMLFMKGLSSAPRCGFSRQIVEILNEENVAYDTFDILQDEEVRQGLKTYSDWPTYPQLYVGGELIGGLDIVKEMKSDGSLHDVLCPP